MDLKTLAPGDEAALEAFLRAHADTSMFLRSNARAGGLADRGAPLQATYVAACEGDRIVAVAAHCWNGMVLVQAPVHLDEVVRAAVARSGRGFVRGISGPRAQSLRAREALGLGERAAAKVGLEKLFALDLADLRVPPALAAGAVVCRRARDEDLDLLAAWRADYCVELFQWARGPALDAEARGDIARQHAERALFVLTENGAPVACTAFNARLPDCVQVGGVWTPPALRRRGLARAAVAGSLIEARDEGVGRAILFTGEDNHAAMAAYEAIGFRVVGDYGLVLFSDL